MQTVEQIEAELDVTMADIRAGHLRRAAVWQNVASTAHRMVESAMRRLNDETDGRRLRRLRREVAKQQHFSAKCSECARMWLDIAK